MDSITVAATRSLFPVFAKSVYTTSSLNKSRIQCVRNLHGLWKLGHLRIPSQKRKNHTSCSPTNVQLKIVAACTTSVPLPTPARVLEKSYPLESGSLCALPSIRVPPLEVTVTGGLPFTKFYADSSGQLRRGRVQIRTVVRPLSARTFTSSQQGDTSSSAHSRSF